MDKEAKITNFPQLKTIFLSNESSRVVMAFEQFHCNKIEVILPILKFWYHLNFNKPLVFEWTKNCRRGIYQWQLLLNCPQAQTLLGWQFSSLNSGCSWLFFPPFLSLDPLCLSTTVFAVFCDFFQVKIHLPDTSYSDVQLNVTDTFLDCQTPKQ